MSETTTTTTGAADAAHGSHGRATRPSMLRIGASRIGYETKGVLPLARRRVLHLPLPDHHARDLHRRVQRGRRRPAAPGPRGISVGAYYLPGMLAAGMLLSGVQNLAVDIATEKGDGTLKRLGGTPLSPVSYFLGKIGQVFVTGIAAGGAAPARPATRVRHRAAD